MSFKQFFTYNWRLISQNNLFINRFSNSILESQNNGFTQKAITSTDLPIKPKKPIPPFFKFLHEKRPELINKHTLSLKDAARVLSEMWKNFDVDAKTKMTEVYSKELQKYKENLKIYNDSLTNDQKNELFRLKYVQLEQKAKRKLKRELKYLGKPRKPLTAYLIFVSDEIKNRGNTPVKEYMITIAKKWHAMDINDKTKYIEAASAENDKYNTDILKWEDNMIKAGRFDIIRSRPVPNNDIDNN